MASILGASHAGILNFSRSGRSRRIGDKTQFLSFVLATRFRRPFPIIAGILSATLLNHALAGSVGVWLADMVPRPALNWLVSLACIGFGVWALRTDALDNIPLRTGQAHS
jgi:putative Ca2+/H+ antiporter (TMEM165/GDT1 family)